MRHIERLAANDDNALCNQADMTFQHALAELPVWSASARFCSSFG